MNLDRMGRVACVLTLPLPTSDLAVAYFTVPDLAAADLTAADPTAALAYLVIVIVRFRRTETDTTNTPTFAGYFSTTTHYILIPF
jgi:hypothetical protein